MSSHIIHATYRFAAASVASDAVIGRIVGPVGMRGKITSMTAMATTTITTTPGTLTAGHSGNAAAYMTLSLPLTAAPLRIDGVLSIPYDRGGYPGSNPDRVIEIAAGGEPTAGAADICVTVEWT